MRTTWRCWALRHSVLSPQSESFYLLDCSNCEAFDEAIEEDVVQNSDRYGGDQAAGHQRLPVENVAAHEERRHAHADGLVSGGGNECQRVDEVLRHERESEDHHCQNA